MLRLPVETRLVRGADAVRIVEDDQRFAGLRIAAVRVSRFGQQFLCIVDRAANRVPVLQHMGDRIDRLLVRLVAEKSRRDRAHRRLRRAVVVEEHRAEFLPVDRDRQRLSQLAILLLLRRRIALADDRIEHVESDVPVRRLEGRDQLNLVLLDRFPASGLVDRFLQERKADIEAAHVGIVVIPLHEFRFFGLTFLLQREHNLVEERHLLAGIGEPPMLLIAGHAVGRIRIAAIIRIAFENIAVGSLRSEHEWPGTDRPCVERQRVACHAALTVEAVCFPRRRDEERHRGPEFELRILADHFDLERVIVDRTHAGERHFAQIAPRQIRIARIALRHRSAVLGLQLIAERLQSNDVLIEEVIGRSRCRNVGTRKPFGLVDVVVGRRFAR